MKKKLLKFLLIPLLSLAYNISLAQQFTVYNTWDFENMSIGICNEDTLDKYFNYTEKPGYFPNEDLVYIVSDTINGQATKVMRIKNRAHDLYHGFGMNIYLTDDKTEFDEIYVSYNWKFSEEFNSTSGGKLPGLIALPRDPNMGPDCPRPGYGFFAAYMYKQAGSMISYHYDRTPHGYSGCPWATERYNYNKIYFNNASWYNITERLVMNTFTEGIPNNDGLKETWVDGRLIFQEKNQVFMEDESDTMKIDAFRIVHFYGGSSDSYKPVTACWGYLDNIKVWMPENDSVSGAKAHVPSTILPTPDEIIDREVYYDSLVTTEGTLSNSEYGMSYSPCIDETYLIDAGEGHTVSYNITSGAMGDGDFMFFYDGNTTDAKLINMVNENTSSFSGIRKSTGRYLFVRFSTDTGGGTSGWSGEVSFENQTTGMLEKKIPREQTEKIRAFPNPGSNTLIFRGIESEADITVFDVLGKKIFHKKSICNDQPVNISEWSPGAYTIMLTDTHTHALKFIKN